MDYGFLDRYYDLEAIVNHTELTMLSYNSKDIVQSRIMKYKHVKLININGLGIGQAHFETDDGSYLLLPWCYIISMIPSKENNK